MKFRTYFNDKSIHLIDAIIVVENLDVSRRVVVNALSDDVIEVFGNKEEIRILKEIYTMVGGN